MIKSHFLLSKPGSELLLGKYKSKGMVLRVFSTLTVGLVQQLFMRMEQDVPSECI